MTAGTMTEAAQPTVEHVAPDAITIEDNVREAIDLPRAFVASIKTHGVLQPVLATQAEDGTLRVRDGQRRTLAAREAGIASMPAYIVDAGDTATVRIVQQIVANDQRDGLTEADRVQGFAALALEGMSVAAIAKATGHKRAQVEQSVKVAASKQAASVLTTPGVTLEAAAALAEFDGDEDAQSEILRAIERDPNGVEWVANRIRKDRERQALIEAASAPLREAGTRVLTDEESYDAVRLAGLSDVEATEDGWADPLDEDAHATGCEGHAVTVTVNYQGEPTIAAYCTTPDQHHDRYGRTATTKQSGPMTDEQKAQRRALIANNKAWDAAEATRREWVATFLARKTMPKDATAFAATVLADRLMGVDHKARNTVRDLAPEHVDQKPVHALVALAVAAVEPYTGRHTWRNPTSSDRAYFAQIGAWGYPLSDVEKIAAGIEVDEPTEA